MKRIFPCLLLALFAAVLILPAIPSADDAHWPQWRGPMATGAAGSGTPPLEWSETKNVKWRVEVPGKGSATPVIWGNQIFVLSAVPAEKAAAAGEPGGGGAPAQERQRGGPPRNTAPLVNQE